MPFKDSADGQTQYDEELERLAREKMKAEEHLYLSIYQAEYLLSELKYALDNIKLHQSLGDRIDRLVVTYPKEVEDGK